MTNTAAILDAAVLEEDLQQAVLDYARLRGWRRYHTRDSRRSPEGFPDLVLIRKARLVVAELKRQNRNPSADQEAWLADFAACGAETYVWRPSDWRQGMIEAVLT